MLGFLSPRIQLRDLEIYQPQLHLIVYPDGSTNQPQPRKQSKPGKPVLDRFFDLKAGSIEVKQGVLDYDNRAASFDYQDRKIPLDFAASDVSLRMANMPTANGSPEFYRIEAGVRDLNLARGKPGKLQPPQVHGFLQATLDLTRTTATLRSLRITASGHGIKDRTLEISGVLDDFARPRWHAKAAGDLDMRLVDPITGYPFAPEGLAHLVLAGAGDASSFRADGSIHVEDGAYIGTGVVATGFKLDAHIHADPEQLLITSILLRLRQGGEIDGDLSLAR
jgi:translocation and assembly module TamB